MPLLCNKRLKNMQEKLNPTTTTAFPGLEEPWLREVRKMQQIIIKLQPPDMPLCSTYQSRNNLWIRQNLAWPLVKITIKYRQGIKILLMHTRGTRVVCQWADRAVFSNTCANNPILSLKTLNFDITRLAIRINLFIKLKSF